MTGVAAWLRLRGISIPMLVAVALTAWFWGWVAVAIHRELSYFDHPRYAKLARFFGSKLDQRIETLELPRSLAIKLGQVGHATDDDLNKLLRVLVDRLSTAGAQTVALVMPFAIELNKKDLYNQPLLLNEPLLEAACQSAAGSGTRVILGRHTPSLWAERSGGGGLNPRSFEPPAGAEFAEFPFWAEGEPAVASLRQISWKVEGSEHPVSLKSMAMAVSASLRSAVAADAALEETRPFFVVYPSDLGSRINVLDLRHSELLKTAEIESWSFGALSPERLKALRRRYEGKAVLVGGGPEFLHADTLRSPWGDSGVIPPTAAAVNTLLKGQLVQRVPAAARAAWVVLLVLLGCVMARQPVASSAVIRCSGFWMVMVTASGWAYYHPPQRDTGLILPTLALWSGFLVAFVIHRRQETRANQLRLAFSRYLSDEMVQYVLANPQLARIGPQGVRREAVILFCDIRSFTSISEKLPPEKVSEMLNRYFEKVTRAIQQRGGSVDRLLGDGMMASFGGVVPVPNAEEAAVDAALDMVRVLHDQVHAELGEIGVEPFRIGIGLHRGDVVVKTISERRKMDITLIGDAVNLASRVEGTTKDHAWALVVTRDVVDALGEKVIKYDIQPVGQTFVKGREQPVELYRIVDPARPEIFEL